MNAAPAASSMPPPRRRRNLMRSSSTGTGLNDSPANTNRFVASIAQARRRRASIGGGAADGSLDDIGVSGVKPRNNARRSSLARGSIHDPDSDHFSARSSHTSRKGARRRRRMSIQKGVEDFTKVAAKLKAGDVMGALTNFAMKKVSFDRRAAWNPRLTCPDVQVAIKVQARNLPHRNMKHANAFCVLWEVPNGYTGTTIEGTKGKPSPLPRSVEHEVGRTEVVRDSEHPIFTESFQVEYYFELEQTYLIRVYDEDLGYTQNLSEHYYIGGFVFTLDDLLGRPTQKIITSIDPESEACVVLQGREADTARKFLEHRIAARGLHTSESVVGSTDLYYMVETLEDDDCGWVPIWKSEVVFYKRNFIWGKASLSLLELCGGDMESVVRFTFWESHNTREDEYLGRAVATVNDLAFNVPQEGLTKPIRIKKKVFFGAGNKIKKSGQMQIVKSKLVDRPSFLQYLKGGLELDLIVAVDCEADIDHRDQEKATNFRHGTWLNNYQAALEKIGTIMESYSRSHHFQMWGFNAQISIEDSDNVFVMSNKVAGSQGLLKTYDKMCLGGNRFLGRHEESHLGPLITKAMYRSIQERERRQCYSVLCVLTSGKAKDLNSMMDAVNRAATDAPLSIVFIGCEDNNLEVMERYFERNKVQRSISGIRISRECTTFTSFADCDHDVTKVIAEALEDVPEQMVQRFFQGGINPQPPKVEPNAIPNVHQKQTKKEGTSDHSKTSRHHDHSDSRHRKKKQQHTSKSPERRKHHKSPERGKKSGERGHKAKLRVKPCEIDF